MNPCCCCFLLFVVGVPVFLGIAWLNFSYVHLIMDLHSIGKAPYAHLRINTQSLSSDCLTGAIMFERNDAVLVGLYIAGSSHVVSDQPYVHLDTDWGVHYTTTTTLYNIGYNSAEWGVWLNSGRQATPLVWCNFSICGFHKFFETPNSQITVKSRNAHVSFTTD